MSSFLFFSHLSLCLSVFFPPLSLYLLFSLSLSHSVILSFSIPSLSLFLSLLSFFLSFSLCDSLCLFFQPLSVSLSLLSLSLSFSSPYLSFYLPRTPVSLPIYLSLSLPSLSFFLFFLSLFISHSCFSFFFHSPIPVSLFSLSVVHSLRLYLSLRLLSLFIFFLSISCLPLSTTPVSRPIFLSPTLNLFLSFSLSLTPLSLLFSHSCLSHTPATLPLSLSFSLPLLSLCLSHTCFLSLPLLTN